MIIKKMENIVLEKQCSKCKKWKELENFCNRKDKKQSECKECKRKYRQEHKEEINQYDRKYRQEHKEERNQHDRKYRQEHRKEMLKKERKYRKKNKKRIAQQAKKHREGNKEKITEKAREYFQEHKKERNQYVKTRRKTDPWFRLNYLMSTAISQIKKSSIKKDRPWKQLVPYTLTELKKHLERTLPEGYVWEDFMQGRLHIDHILPKAIFEYEKAEDLGFQICWGLDNLRLLPAEENRKKKAKLIKPFQKHFDIEVKI